MFGCESLEFLEQIEFNSGGLADGGGEAGIRWRACRGLCKKASSNGAACDAGSCGTVKLLLITSAASCISRGGLGGWSVRTSQNCYKDI